MTDMKKKIIYAVSIILLAVIPALGYVLVSGGKNPFGPTGIEHEGYIRAKVIEITASEDIPLDDNGEFVDTVYQFKALVKSGDRKGETLTAYQTISGYAPYNPRPVSVGDSIIITQSVLNDDTSWSFAEYVRSDAIIVITLLFGAALVLFGRMKGLKTLFTLILTVAAVFFVLVPAILTGHNIYLFTILTCLYITVMTLVTVNGLSGMSLVAGLGCMGGVLLSALITLVADIFLKLTGFTDEHAIYIKGIGDGNIDMKALIFAMILVGSIGAVMDVSVDIAASLKEISQKIGRPTFSELYKSGITISRDVIGTMSNTLILAYIGSSLCSVLLIIYNNSFSMLNLFNKENIITEILQILVGSFGILLALPLTSFIGGVIYTRGGKRGKLCKTGVLTADVVGGEEERKDEKENKDDDERDEFVELLKSAEKSAANEKNK